MKKIFCILSVLSIVSPVFADDDPVTPAEPTVYQTSVATAAYVNGAYDALTSAKQDKLGSTNVVDDANTSGPVVTGVSASNGTVTVTKGQVTIPVGSATAPTSQAQIWVQ